MESARAALAADAERLDALWSALVEEISGQRGGAILGATLAPEAAPAAGLADPARLVVAGCIDDVVVGFATVRLDVHAAPALAVVDALYVEPGARDIGVGEAMTELVVAWATAQGCRGVDASALPGNRRAKAFFEDNGFVTRVLTMHRALAAPATGPGAPGRP